MEQDNLKKLEEDLQKLSAPPVPTVEEPIITPTTPPPPLVHEVPKSGSSLSKIATFLIVIALLAIAAYFVGTKFFGSKSAVTPTPISTPTATVDPTANWKTYTNSKYDFELKYPQNWQETSEPVMPGAKYLTLISFNTEPPSTTTKFTVNYFAEITDISKWVGEMQSSGLINARMTDVKTINGLTFYEIGGLSANGDSRGVFVKTLDKGYLKIMMEPYSQRLNQTTFDQFLSTFKFLGQTGTEQIYKNTLYGYQISIPSGWKTANVAAGNTSAEALPNSQMVDISESDSIKTYPNGVISIQVFGAKPTYPSSWTKTQQTINGIIFEKYSSKTESELNSVTLLGKNLKGEYIEILYRYDSVSGQTKLENIVLTFKSTN